MQRLETLINIQIEKSQDTHQIGMVENIKNVICVLEDLIVVMVLYIYIYILAFL